MAEQFDRYAAMKVNRSDSDEVKRDKRRAQEALINALMELESEGLTVEQKKSSIIFYCSHGNPPKFMRKIFPHPQEWKNGQWDNLGRWARSEHRKTCREAR